MRPVVNKTDDIETAICLVLRDDLTTLADLEVRLYRDYPALRNEDRRWIGVAIDWLERAKRIQFPGCEHGSHEGDCKVQGLR